MTDKQYMEMFFGIGASRLSAEDKAKNIVGLMSQKAAAAAKLQLLTVTETTQLHSLKVI